MSKKRTVISVFASGIFCLFAFAALEGEWPSYGAVKWLVFLGGLAVLALVFIALESRLLTKRQRF